MIDLKGQYKCVFCGVPTSSAGLCKKCHNKSEKRYKIVAKEVKAFLKKKNKLEKKSDKSKMRFK